MGILGLLLAGLLIGFYIFFASPLSPLEPSSNNKITDQESTPSSTQNSKPLYQQSIDKAKDAAEKVKEIENQQKQQVDNFNK